MLDTARVRSIASFGPTVYAVRTQRSRCANVVADARHRFLIRERRLVSRFRRGHNSRVARMARLGPDITRQSHEEFPREPYFLLDCLREMCITLYN